MFSTGQTIFALFFVITFTITMILVYRKDKTLHTKNYKGVKWVLISFIGFVIFLFLIKNFLKN